MNEDDILAECLEDPEVKKAGEELRDAVWAHAPNGKCFGMTPIEAFWLCAEAFAKMKEKGILKEEKDTVKISDLVEDVGSTSASIARPSRMSQVKNEPPMGRRAAVEHTKRKIKDGEY